ncbi:unnamed protein product [Bemisia tabaci]|uniref:Ig-like domain-containing protein n=1 Tax=Bemisia tabaci TaxID=7038 RepID=A0A9P0G511_BEMTA|nr:unnamed protein product [Bemisia tabaci]
MRSAACFASSLLCCFTILQGCGCLRDVNLEIKPSIVQRGHETTLFCHYDLEDGAPLYSVKWYRGRHEFYRYSPTERPSTKIFPYEGINVDKAASNASVVVLQYVGFSLSGNLSCEVTADAPSFATAVVSRQILVVELPEEDPVIRTEHNRYFPGDYLIANCTCPPSKPGASMAFYLNNRSILQEEREPLSDEGDELVENIINLSMQLDPSHFYKGTFTLKCSAVVTPLYQKTVEIRLSNSPHQPVPERVMRSGCLKTQRLPKVFYLSQVMVLLSLWR